jgi:hypothetical protein
VLCKGLESLNNADAPWPFPVQTLSWSLKHGGFSLTRPHHEETQLPPIHFCVLGKKVSGRDFTETSTTPGPLRRGGLG